MPSRSAIKFRIRTALFIAAAFSFFLTTYFAASYLTIKHSLTSRGDGEIYQQIDSILSAIHTNADERDFAKLASLHSSTGEAAMGLKLARLENPSKGIQTFGPSRLTSLLDSHIFYVKELPLDIRVGRSTIRILARSSNIFTIFAAINTIAFQEVFDDMTRTYFLLLLSGILLSFLVGFFTAGFALRPLKILVDSARAMKDEREGIPHELPTDTKTLEINELASVMNDILSARDRSIAALKDFTADAAHELRTPLTILKGELEVDLRTKKLSEDEKAGVESNLEEVQRLIRLVEDLLILARAEQVQSNPAEPRSEPWQLSDLIGRIVNKLKFVAEAKNIPILRMGNYEGTISLPQFAVEQIIYNILLNAIQYTPNGKEIHLTIEAGIGNTAVLTVQDQGIGIPSDQIPHIFDRFWRADASASRMHGGTGLGLTIAKKFADLLGITIECTSISGEGTLMTCIFPGSNVSE
ncbi:MAG: sensor histidine kinase [Candidatus Kapaibacterium sp.]